jgi:antitoxin CptB
MTGDVLRWRLRRGMKELDVLLERYVARRYPGAGAGERAAFARLLEREDPEIWQWVLGRAAVPAEFSDVVEQLRRHD